MDLRARGLPVGAASGREFFHDPCPVTDQAIRPQPGGLYVHIPFCRRKCAYCDFFSTTDLSLKPAFLDALAREIAAAEPPPFVFDTIHLGGGTPSVLDPTEVAGILDALGAKFSLVEPVEITIEANPGTLSAAKLAGFRGAGVNRLDVGVQSFRPRNLEFLGRIHTASEAGQTLEWARAAGFDNLGVDLIYGLPGQGRRDWREDLAQALAFEPEHIACYMLSVEPVPRSRSGFAPGGSRRRPMAGWPGSSF